MLFKIEHTVRMIFRILIFWLFVYFMYRLGLIDVYGYNLFKWITNFTIQLLLWVLGYYGILWYLEVSGKNIKIGK